MSRRITITLSALIALMSVGIAADASPRQWTVQPLPKPAGATGATLNGVVCLSPTACVAVGYSQRAGTSFTLAESKNGSHWTIQRTPIPAGANSSDLTGLACPSPTVCTAVGWDTDRTGAHALVEAWNGSRWKIQQTPFPAGGYPNTWLHGVACSSPRACMAVGGSSGSFAESWNGSQWSIQRTPTPAGAANVELNGVTCSSPSACIAVGSYLNQAATGVVLVESWNGSRWTIQPTPDPNGALSSTLFGVACQSVSTCMAVGYDNSQADTFGVLAESWNGAHWKLQSIPAPGGTTSATLNGVACPSPTACTAVGYDIGQSNNYNTLVEAWNGSRWTIQGAQHLSGVLFGVTCRTEIGCTAVGSLIASRRQ